MLRLRDLTSHGDNMSDLSAGIKALNNDLKIIEESLLRKLPKDEHETLAVDALSLRWR